MRRYAAPALLIIGLAGQALTEPIHEAPTPTPELARMSTRDMLGLGRRVIEGYSPTEQLCHDGNTCAEACGKGFVRCASNDKLKHCYNPSEKQTCCPGGTGDSCDEGYFCSADTRGAAWCCPDGMSLQECAKRYDMPGPLTSQAPPSSTITDPTSTEHSPTKTRHAAETSSSSSSLPTSKEPAEIGSTASISTTTTHVHEVTTSGSGVQETSMTGQWGTTITSSSGSSSVISSTLSTTETGVTATASLPVPSSTTTELQGGGGVSYGPISGFAVFVAGALAALV
ncbi:hypothetical protein F5Y17DRAFT_442708 [Xylariaceae sp. FL0594]|nr:hypothetical protein F5Y17DRAFT_442708 [Xylariaceae sp. FL0594]